jgi:hypothetical protein
MYKQYADDLISAKDWPQGSNNGGPYLAARPLGWQGGIIYRFRQAWAVFTGKADAMFWRIDEPAPEHRTAEKHADMYGY